MFTKMAQLAEIMADDLSIGDEEIQIAIGHLRKTVKAADDVGITAPDDALCVKRILEEVARHRNIHLQ